MKPPFQRTFRAALAILALNPASLRAIPSTGTPACGSDAADAIAASIAEDSGLPPADFIGYADRLAQTLNGFTPEQQIRILGASVAADLGITLPENGGD